MATKKIMQAPIERVDRTPVVFENQYTGLHLAGIVYRPRNCQDGEKLPTIIVGGPMASVKELTQSLYAQLLAERGYEDPEVKELQVIAEATHFDMYDLEEYVTQNLQHIERFLKANL